MAWDPRETRATPRRALLMASPPRKQYILLLNRKGPAQDARGPTGCVRHASYHARPRLWTSDSLSLTKAAVHSLKRQKKGHSRWIPCLVAL